MLLGVCARRTKIRTKKDFGAGRPSTQAPPLMRITQTNNMAPAPSGRGNATTTQTATSAHLCGRRGRGNCRSEQPQQVARPDALRDSFSIESTSGGARASATMDCDAKQTRLGKLNAVQQGCPHDTFGKPCARCQGQRRLWNNSTQHVLQFRRSSPSSLPSPSH